MMEQFSGWTLGFFVVISGLTLYFHFFRYHIRITETGPAILTSIGIFGTFLGVAIGLWGFDSTDIQGSVPKLMDGLKTAFWSSIAGLLGSLTLKARAVLSQTLGAAPVSARHATIDDLDNSLRQLAHSLSADSSESLPQLLNAHHRQLATHLQQINHSLETYQERQAEANAKALVSAIEMVMREFNTKINEQYGENFKQLNESVLAMLEWQKTYKAQLSQLIIEQERTASSMNEASNAFEYMVRHANAFNGISESLQDLLSGLEAQRANLHEQLGSLASLVNHAADGLPMLEERITALTTGMATAVEGQQKWLNNELTALQKSNLEQLRSLQTQSTQQLQDQQQQSTQHLQRLAERVERQVGLLDASLEEELNKALKTFGMQLAALSEKFVSDYTPLTKRLQTLVSLAEQVDE